MKLNFSRTFLVGLAFMSICAFWQLYDGIVPLIMKNTFGLNDTVAGAVMALDNVLAIFMLPLFGMLSDKTNSKLGKRTPYIIGGTVAACIFIFIIPLSDAIKSLPLFMVGLGLVLVSMAVYRSPAVALMPDVTPKPLRSKGNAIINLMGAVGGIIMLGVIAVMVPKTDNPSYLSVFIFTATFMAMCIAILKATVNEPELAARMKEESKAFGIEEDVPEPTHKKAKKQRVKIEPDVKKSLILILLSVFLWFMGYNAVTTAFSKYANVYWGLQGGSYAYTLIIAQAAAIISYIPVGIIASRIGRKKTILGGIVLLTIAFGSSVFFQTFSGIIFFFFILAGVGWASINVNSYPMVVELSRGGDVGAFTGYYYTASMLAQIITPILSGAVLQYMGYVYLFPYGAIFVALSFVTMRLVKHGDSKPAPSKSKLEAFDVGDD